MPVNPKVILSAEMGLVAYSMPLTNLSFIPDLSKFERKVEAIIQGIDAKIGPVSFGFVSSGPQGLFLTIRGTELGPEWEKDFEALLVPCYLVEGSKWHKGFGEIYSTLTINGKPISDFMGMAPVTIGGHSLGCPLAAYTSLECNCETLIMLAPPKPGDSILAAAIRKEVKEIFSFANIYDIVPKLPLTLKWPLKIEDFEHIVSLSPVDPDSVTPPISKLLAPSHSLANYLTLLENFT